MLDMKDRGGNNGSVESPKILVKADPYATDLHRRTDAFLLIFIFVLIALVSGASAHGASATWNANPTDSNWVTSPAESNWSTGAETFPGSLFGTTNGDTATFTGASAQLLIAINAASLNIKSITFSGSGEPAYTIGTASGNSLLLSNGGSISIASTTSGANNANSVNAPLILEPSSATGIGSYTFSNASGTASHPLIIGGPVTGGNTTANIALTLTGANMGNNIVGGFIGDGNATGGISITKSSSGTWILGGNNSYTGTTQANSGTLLINGNQSAATGAVSVNNSGTTLGGTGTIGGVVTVNAGANITGAANGTVGTLTLTSSASFVGTSMANLATYVVDLSGAASDKLTISTELNLSNVFDRILFNGTADGVTTYTLATYASHDGTFNFVGNLPDNYQLIYNDASLQLAPLTAVPEPSTWAAAALALGALALTQRRRLRTIASAGIS